MFIVGGTLLAWAVSLRLLSNALFVALAAYVQLWVTILLGLLHLFGVDLRQETHCLQQVSVCSTCCFGLRPSHCHQQRPPHPTLCSLA